MLKPMLLRLQTALAHDNLMPQLVLLPAPPRPTPQTTGDRSVNVIVGYSGSSHSQAALDLGLWIAHQTRLVQPKPVLVHVVYVVDQTQPETIENADRVLWQARCLASEWWGSLTTHLRIGTVADELCQVAAATRSEVMLVGCRTVQDGLIQQLTGQVPCAVLGIPNDPDLEPQSGYPMCGHEQQ